MSVIFEPIHYWCWMCRNSSIATLSLPNSSLRTTWTCEAVGSRASQSLNAASGMGWAADIGRITLRVRSSRVVLVFFFESTVDSKNDLSWPEYLDGRAHGQEGTLGMKEGKVDIRK